MRGQKKALREYQQALIDAYYDDWIHEMLDSLYEAFQQWKPGLIIPTEISAAITINGMDKRIATTRFVGSLSGN